MKKVMPFAEIRKQMLILQGPSVFNQTSSFDETNILSENINYLTNTLELEGIDIKRANEADTKIQEECCPLQPFMVFRAEKSHTLQVINNQPYTPMFELQVPVYEGDTGFKIINRIAKENRIKGIP